MPNEERDMPESERQLEAAESGHYGHAQQRATAPGGGQQGNDPQAASEATEGGNVADNYLHEQRQLEAEPPLPQRAEP